MQRLTELLGVPRKLLVIFAAMLVVWTLAIIATGAQVNIFPVEWDFTNSGAFGDSFGPLSAAMALIAAVSAIAAYRAQAREIARLQSRQEVEDAERLVERQRFEKRQTRIDKASQRVSFEGTYFKLLETFRSIVSQIDINTTSGHSKSGHDSFNSIIKNVEQGSNIYHGNISKAWHDAALKHRNDLNHYFRFMYHIVLFVEKSAIKEKYFYVRLLRALLSESELVMLGLNCEYGEGREKFRALVERYALLHNMSEGSRRRWFKNTEIKPSAFDRL